MFVVLLLLIPLLGTFLISLALYDNQNSYHDYLIVLKSVALNASVCALFISLIIFALFDFSSNQFQFVQEYHEIGYFDLYLGIDGLSIYFVLLTTIIMPISLLSNWVSIWDNLKPFLLTILLLEILLLLVFLVLDLFLFYIFFESILPPLFVLIGLFGSSKRVRASFYLFLYTLMGSLFLLLAIVTIYSTMGTTDLDALFKTNFNYSSQLALFGGIFIAFAVKTPTVFFNTWLLKAHVESPLSGSIILAGIVLKLSLYGVIRLILPLLPKAYLYCTSFVYLVGVLTIIYASISTLRTVDVKELIAYSSVSHAAVYLMGVFSNTIQGIEGGIALGLAHGFVSSGLFICAGGVLYDRSSTRLITHYRGLAQLMPLFSVILFILSLGNCGAPLTLNFVGEFMSLYGAFVKSPSFGALASSSIIFSAAYTIYMFNRITFAGSYSKFFQVNIPDLNKREFYILLTLVVFTVGLGIYPSTVLDGLHYSVTTLTYVSPYICIIPFKYVISKDFIPRTHVSDTFIVQSGFITFKQLKKTVVSSWPVWLFAIFVYINYRSPTRFMLEQLHLSAYYPLFNCFITCAMLLVVHGLKNEKTNPCRIAFVIFVGVIITTLGLCASIDLSDVCFIVITAYHLYHLYLESRDTSNVLMNGLIPPLWGGGGGAGGGSSSGSAGRGVPAGRGGKGYIPPVAPVWIPRDAHAKDLWATIQSTRYTFVGGGSHIPSVGTHLIGTSGAIAYTAITPGKVSLLGLAIYDPEGQMARGYSTDRAISNQPCATHVANILENLQYSHPGKVALKLGLLNHFSTPGLNGFLSSAMVANNAPGGRVAPLERNEIEVTYKIIKTLRESP